MKSGLKVIQLVRPEPGHTLRPAASPTRALPTPTRNKWLISQSLHSFGQSWIITQGNMTKPCSLSGKFNLCPHPVPPTQFCYKLACLYFLKISSDKAICRGRVLTHVRETGRRKLLTDRGFCLVLFVFLPGIGSLILLQERQVLTRADLRAFPQSESLY